jgi:hypothetical protein
MSQMDELNIIAIRSFTFSRKKKEYAHDIEVRMGRSEKNQS